MSRVRSLPTRAPSTFAVAAVTATALVASAPQAQSAAPKLGRAVAASCTPGHAVRVAPSMAINGKAKTDVAIKGGDKIHTGPDGQVKVCLQQGAVRCDVWADSTIVVLPTPRVIMRVPQGQTADVFCKANNTGKHRELELPGQKITLGTLGLKPTPRPRYLAGRGVKTSSGYLFSLAVRGGKTVVKVRRGATIVAARNSIRRGVVLGRNQQVVAKRGGLPGKPASIQLTRVEDATLDQLARLLPRDQDIKAPAPAIKGPKQGSSLRSPTFRFEPRPAEPGVIFSCSLNSDNDFRVCSDGQPFGRLRLGANHIFVKATDASGNTTRRAKRYDWSIKDIPIVYARGPAGGNTDLYVMESDGTAQTRLTDDSAHTRAPEWSPDHTRIVFDSDVGGNADIYVMSRTGNERTKLTTSPAPELNPTWSPDGKRIAFESRLQDDTRDLYTMNSDGTNVRRLTSNRADDLDPSWSPDGTRIAFASTRGDNYDIWVIDAEGGQPTDLTNTPDYTEFGPSWSPDGKLIAFHRKGIKIPNDIFVMKPDGSSLLKITKTGWDDQNPAWAPNSREIVFQSGRVAGGADSDIYFVSLDVDIETRLTTDLDYEYLPDW